MSESRSGLNLWMALLIGSVLLNGVLLGVTLQRSFSPSAPSHVRSETVASPGRFNGPAFIQALPEDVREDARERLRQSRSVLGGLMRTAVQTRVEAMTLMQSETATEEDILQALQRARQARNEVEARGEIFVMEIIAGLEPEDRVRALNAAYSRDFGRHRMRRPPPPPGEDGPQF